MCQHLSNYSTLGNTLAKFFVSIFRVGLHFENLLFLFDDCTFVNPSGHSTTPRREIATKFPSDREGNGDISGTISSRVSEASKIDLDSNSASNHRLHLSKDPSCNRDRGSSPFNPSRIKRKSSPPAWVKSWSIRASFVRSLFSSGYRLRCASLSAKGLSENPSEGGRLKASGTKIAS